MSEKAKLVGINHVALEVGDVDEALVFYGGIFELSLRGRARNMAFVDMGDQFIALAAGGDSGRPGGHFGLVVDSKETARAALQRAGARILPGRGLDFLDPWGNHVQVVEYSEVQFTKGSAVLRGMELELPKSPSALEELRRKGLAGDS